MSDAPAETLGEAKRAVPSSGLACVAVRVSNFRSLRLIETTLDRVTVILGANNAGKSSFLEALCIVIGAQRRTVGKDDIHLADGEGDVPRDRRAIVDLLIRPVDDDGNIISAFPGGSYWIELFNQGISQDEEYADFVGIRATMAWSLAHDEYRVERPISQGMASFPGVRESGRKRSNLGRSARAFGPSLHRRKAGSGRGSARRAPHSGVG